MERTPQTQKMLELRSELSTLRDAFMRASQALSDLCCAADHERRQEAKNLADSLLDDLKNPNSV